MKKKCANCNCEFNVKPSHYDLRLYCSRKCSVQKRKNDFIKTKELAKDKLCKSCGKVKPLSMFWKKLNGFTSSCSDCSKVICREYRKNNPESISKTSRKMYEKNRDRVIKYAKMWNKNNPKKRSKIMIFQNAKRRGRINAALGIEMTRGMWDIVKLYFNNKCAYCGSHERISIEHFYPISKGGKHCISNIIPCCTLCNSRKNNQEPINWVLSKFGYDVLDGILEYLENCKQILGWKVLRYTAANYEQIQKDIEAVLKAKK